MNTFIKSVVASFFFVTLASSTRLRQLSGMANIAATAPSLALGAVGAAANLGTGAINGAVSVPVSATGQLTGNLNSNLNAMGNLALAASPVIGATASILP